MGRNSRINRFKTTKSTTNPTKSKKPTIPPKQPKNTSPTHASGTGVGDTIKQGAGLGLGMGLGSSVAHMAFDKLTGNNDFEPQIVPVPSTNSQTCSIFVDMYKDCIITGNDNQCKIFIDNYEKCVNK